MADTPNPQPARGGSRAPAPNPIASEMGNLSAPVGSGDAGRGFSASTDTGGITSGGSGAYSGGGGPAGSVLPAVPRTETKAAAPEAPTENRNAAAPPPSTEKSASSNVSQSTEPQTVSTPNQNQSSTSPSVRNSQEAHQATIDSRPSPKSSESIPTSTPPARDLFAEAKLERQVEKLRELQTETFTPRSNERAVARERDEVPARSLYAPDSSKDGQRLGDALRGSLKNTLPAEGPVKETSARMEAPRGSDLKEARIDRSTSESPKVSTSISSGSVRDAAEKPRGEFQARVETVSRLAEQILKPSASDGSRVVAAEPTLQTKSIDRAEQAVTRLEVGKSAEAARTTNSSITNSSAPQNTVQEQRPLVVDQARGSNSRPEAARVSTGPDRTTSSNMVRGSSQVVVVPVGTKRPIEKKPDLKVRTSQPGAKADGAKLGHKGGTHSQRTTEPKSGLSKAVPKKPQDVVGAKVKDADKSLTKSAATKGIEKAPGTKQPTGEPAAKDLKALAPGAVSNKQESNRGVTRSAQGKENQATDTRAKAPAADKAGSRTGDAARSTRAQAESTKAVSDRDPKVSLAPTSAKDTPVKSLGNKGSAATDSKEAGLLKREKEAGTFSKLAERVKSGEATSVEKVVYEVGKFVKGLFGFKDMSEAPLDPTSTQQVLHLEENADVDSDSLLDSEEKVELEEQESDISEVAGVFNIRGRVVEFASARPLPGVTLSLGGFGSATTDNQGEYVFENVLAGTAYTLSIEEGAYDFLPSSVSGVLTGYANHHFFGKVRLH